MKLRLREVKKLAQSYTSGGSRTQTHTNSEVNFLIYHAISNIMLI